MLTRVRTALARSPYPRCSAKQRIVGIEDETPGEKLTEQVDWTKSGFGGLLRATSYGSITQPA